MSTIEVLVPDGPHRQPTRELAGRLRLLSGVALALHDNAKPGAVELLDAIGAGLVAEGVQLRRWSKAHAARPSPHIAEMAATAGAAVFALGD